MKVSDLCRQDFVIGTGPEMTVRDAAARMAEDGVGSLIVVDHSGALVGIITDRDIVVRCTAQGLSPEKVAVEEAMSKPVVTISHKADLEDAARLMRRHEIRRLPVLDQHGKVLGMLSFDELLAKSAEVLTELAAIVNAARHESQSD